VGSGIVFIGHPLATAYYMIVVTYKRPVWTHVVINAADAVNTLGRAVNTVCTEWGS
jgi:uncharacterized protein (DUF983 family)